MKLQNYYIIFDLECTCEEGDKFQNTNLDNKEILQIGAVKVTSEFDLIEDYRLETQFSVYCKPAKNPNISDYCSNLLNVSKNLILYCPEFKEVYDQFIQWSEQPLLWLSWSDDYTLLAKECERGTIKPFSQRRWFDAREVMRLLRGRPAEGLDREIKTYNVDLEGSNLVRHNACSDSIITAKVLKQAYIRNKGFIK